MVWQDHVPIDILEQEKPAQYEHVIYLDNKSDGHFEFLYVVPLRFSRFTLTRYYDKKLVSCGISMIRS
jgi:hypothetical protein